MSDYIERDKLLDEIEAARENGGMGAVVAGTLLRYIKRAEAANVRPAVRGRWKYFRKQNKAVCTVCSFERDLDQNFGKAIACPNCGAGMKEDDEI